MEGTSRKIAAIPYYGGKFRMARHIVPIIESIPHKVYVEPFAGGASVLLSMRDRLGDKTLVLNDMNRCLIMLYKVIQCFPEDLLQTLHGIPFSRYEYQQAKFRLTCCDPTDESPENCLRIATDSYLSLCMSFNHTMGDRSGWRVDRLGGTDPTTWVKRKAHLATVVGILQECYIDCADYASCIDRWDSVDTLFYIDPPYVGTELGHYGTNGKSYSVSQFDAPSLDALHAKLDTIKGRYILSGYETESRPSTAESLTQAIPDKKRFNAGKTQKNNAEHLWIKRA